MPHSSALIYEIAAKFAVCSAQKCGVLAHMSQSELLAAEKRRQAKVARGGSSAAGQGNS